MTGLSSFTLRPEELVSVAQLDLGRKRFVIYADSDDNRADAVRTAEIVGGRIVGPFAIGEGAELGDVTLVELSADTGGDLDHFLDWVDLASDAEQLAVVINCARDIVDTVAARITAPTVTLMADASLAERLAAIAMASATRRVSFHDIAADDTLRLARIADEVARIAKSLSDLAGAAPESRGLGDGMIGYRAEPPRPAAPRAAVSADEVRAVIRLRRLRDRFFQAELFADPAWDMLLDLTAARLERVRVAVSSLCIAAAVPPTTALRWIRTMTDAGILVRVADPADARRVFIELSDGAHHAMQGYFRAARENGWVAA